ncbi:MAG TPA: GxxExxY protein [Thermoguttaceae bacterium]
MLNQRDPQTYAILGACMEVHNELGYGFLEAVYQEALQYELTQLGVPFAREVPLPVRYKDETLQCAYKADFICYESVIVELKALAQLTTIEYAQIINYLKATGLQRGLLINFGAPRLEYKRFIRSGDNENRKIISADNADEHR